VEFELHFIRFFTDSLLFMSPVLTALLLTIALLGLWVGRIEEWKTEDALYFAFVTATTVGYGDLHPSQRRSKFIAITISIVGILLTGLLVALALNAVSFAFQVTHDIEQLKERYHIESAKPEPSDSP
jgi:voltage-gated potassium channel